MGGGWSFREAVLWREAGPLESLCWGEAAPFERLCRREAAPLARLCRGGRLATREAGLAVGRAVSEAVQWRYRGPADVTEHW